MEPTRWSRWVTIVAVLMLAGIAAVVSYSHMYELALRHGEPEWRAALFPLSVDGMIVASSMTLLGDARRGRKGGLLPWAFVGSQRFCPREASRPGEMLWCLNEVSLNSSHRVVQFSIRWIPGFATSEHQTGQPVRLIA